jgi:hypothetical protein
MEKPREACQINGFKAGVISTPEIAQYLLGDLTYKDPYLRCTCSFSLLKPLWDTGKTILTSVAIRPKSSNASTIYPSAYCSLFQKHRLEGWSLSM